MTAQEINLAIFAAIGGTRKLHRSASMGEYYSYHCSAAAFKEVYCCPNFCVDLNAMHEAEDELSLDEQDHYAQTLTEMFHGSGWSFALIHATAAQRAEAFLRTIGKWEDG